MRYPNKKQTLVALKKFEKFHVSLGLSNLYDKVKKIHEEIEKGQFKLVVVGEVKKGKSSLINALLGVKKLLPEYSDVATSTSFKLVFGNERENTVFFKNLKQSNSGNINDFEEIFTEDVDDHETRVISDDELADFGTEKGNPGNTKNVDFIQIQLPNEILKTGLEIYDTPGLGGLFQHHAEVTWKHIPTADAVIFVFDSTDSPITKEEENWIRKVKNFTPVIIFAQTKIDLVSSEQWKSWQDRNLNKLLDIFDTPPEELKYFPLSSHYRSATDDINSKAYERSGFIPLENFLFQNLHAEIVGSKCQTAISLLVNGLSKKEKELKQQLKVKEETSLKKLKVLEEKYLYANTEMKEIETKVYPELREDFISDLSEIMHEGTQKISDLLQASRLNSEIRNFIKSMDLEEKSPKKINNDIDRLVGLFTDEMSQKALTFYVEYKNRVLSLATNYIISLDESLQKVVVTEQEVNTKLESKSLISEEEYTLNRPTFGEADKLRFDNWDATKNIFISSGVGNSLGYVAGTLIAIAYPPAAVYTMLIAITGGGIGILSSSISTKQKRRKQVLNHLQTLMVGVMSQLQKRVINQFKLDITNTRKEIAKEVRKAIQEVKTFNFNQIKSIKEQIQREGEVNKEEVKKLRNEANTVKNMLLYLKKIN